MLISLNWIKDFVEIPDLSPKEIGSSFTLTTAEVEDIKVTGEGLQNVLCIQVISFKPHPDSDKLNLVTFDIGGVPDERSCLWSSKCKGWSSCSICSHWNNSSQWNDS